jgi:hypothetical protein
MLENIMQPPSATPAQNATATYGSNSVPTNRCTFPWRGKEYQNSVPVITHTASPSHNSFMPKSSEIGE